MFGRIPLWNSPVLDFFHWEIFFFLITKSFSLLVIGLFKLFLFYSVLAECTHLEIHPFLLGCPISWHIIICSMLLWFFIFLYLGIGCYFSSFASFFFSSFIFYFVYLGTLLSSWAWLIFFLFCLWFQKLSLGENKMAEKYVDLLRGVGGVHLSPQIHQKYTFRHRSVCRTPAESGQEPTWPVEKDI